MLAGALAACRETPLDGPAPRVLVFSKTAAFRHASIEPAVEAFRRLGTEHGFAIDATEDAAAFTSGNLSTYDAVVFLLTTGDVLDDGQQLAFEGFIRGGGGFVGIHSASDTEYDWPWYGRLVGGYFDGHPSSPNVRDGTLLVVTSQHPATATLPDPWVRTDEWYDIRDFSRDDVTVLLDIDERSYKTDDEQPAAAPRAIAWSREFEGGRAFYTALGHTVESYIEALFLDHVWGGLRYVLDRE
jgi:type 1 glutamine amidotransferase